MTPSDNRVPAPNDPALLEAVQRGDTSALRELLERHAPSVFRFAMKMCRNREDAEEVMQETLLAAVRGAKDVRDADSLSAWFYAVARSFCIKMRRHKHVPRALVPVDENVADTQGGARSPDEEALARELGAALDDALGELEHKYREVIVLRDVEGLSAYEVGKALGISVEAVKSRLHRARAAVRARLGPFVPRPDVSVGPARSAPCAEIGTTFSRYLEGEIGPDECAAMQRHVDGCSSCSAVCEGLRRTVALCRRAGAPPLSEDLQQSIRRALDSALQGAPSTANDPRRSPKKV